MNYKDYWITRSKTTTLMNHLGGYGIAWFMLSGFLGPFPWVFHLRSTLEVCHPGTKRLLSPFEFRLLPVQPFNIWALS